MIFSTVPGRVALGFGFMGCPHEVRLILTIV